MDGTRALLIVGQNGGSGYHHRGQHLAAHLGKRFSRLDVVSPIAGKSRSGELLHGGK